MTDFSNVDINNVAKGAILYPQGCVPIFRLHYQRHIDKAVHVCVPVEAATVKYTANVITTAMYEFREYIANDIKLQSEME